MTVPTLDRMNQGRCSHCRQRFYTGPKQPRRLLCPFCRTRLDSAPPSRLDDQPVLPHAFVPIPSATAGSFEPNSATYSSIVDFIDERRQRLFSRERDVGLRWRHGETIYRAAWIEDTRELYLVQLGTPDRGGGHVELLAAGLELEELREAVAGWREAQDDGDHSLDWLRDRVQRLTATRTCHGRRLAHPSQLAMHGVAGGSTEMGGARLERATSCL